MTPVRRSASLRCQHYCTSKVQFCQLNETRSIHAKYQQPPWGPCGSFFFPAPWSGRKCPQHHRAPLPLRKKGIRPSYFLPSPFLPSLLPRSVSRSRFLPSLLPRSVSRSRFLPYCCRDLSGGGSNGKNREDLISFWRQGSSGGSLGRSCLNCFPFFLFQ